MSRKQPPAVGGSAEVVSIGIGGNHHPDYSRVASGQVAAARSALGLDLKDFTRLIRDLTGWDVLPSAVAAWEDDVEPPGAVVTACYGVTHGLPTVASLLAAVPAQFSAERLAGPWVTSYEFPHAGKPHFHADIAHITAETGSSIRAVNHPPEPRSQGRRRPFRNEITADLHGRHLVGQWQNTSDTRYLGTLHLAVLPGEMVMEGRFTGVASDVAVSDGEWKWVRLEPDPDADLAGITLRDPRVLHELVMTHEQIDVPLTLADIGEEA